MTCDGGGFSATNVSLRWSMIQKVYEGDPMIIRKSYRVYFGGLLSTCPIGL
jgi:hypothetical protein